MNSSESFSLDFQSIGKKPLRGSMGQDQGWKQTLKWRLASDLFYRQTIFSAPVYLFYIFLGFYP